MIARKRGDLKTVMERIRKANGESPAFDKFVALSQRLEANIGSLEEAIAERTNLHTQITTLLDALHRVHAQVIEKLAQYNNQNQALEISEKAHLIVSLIGEGATIREPTELKPIQDRFKVAVESLNKIDVGAHQRGSQKDNEPARHISDKARRAYLRAARANFSPRPASTERSTKTSPFSANSIAWLPRS